jgi:hypothetical protein
MLTQIDDDEDLEPWVNMVTHSNVITCIEVFVDEVLDLKFRLTEMTNGGTLVSLIESKKLNLSYEVPRSYRMFIYDVIIQIV